MARIGWTMSELEKQLAIVVICSPMLILEEKFGCSRAREIFRS